MRRTIKDWSAVSEHILERQTQKGAHSRYFAFQMTVRPESRWQKAQQAAFAANRLSPAADSSGRYIKADESPFVCAPFLRALSFPQRLD